MRAFGGAALVLILSADGGSPAAADEGQWFGRGVLVTVSTKVAQAEDRANHTLSVTEMDGVVINGDSKPFLDKDRYRILISPMPV